MGLNKDSMGLNAVDLGLVIKKTNATDKIIALGGNPNVGKSTVFNALTGLRQHTGNWPGKTVVNAQGYCTYRQAGYIVVDLPGCYSLMAHSTEEEVARDFICFGGADAIIVVCDATCLERSLNLALQTMEMNPNVVICVNLMDEAKKKGIRIHLNAISKKMGVPVVGTAARNNHGLDALMRAVTQVIENPQKQRPVTVSYPDYLETAIAGIEPYVKQMGECAAESRWLSLLLLQRDPNMGGFMDQSLQKRLFADKDIALAITETLEGLERQGITENRIKDDIVSALVNTAGEICRDTVVFENKGYKNKDVKIDRILTGKWTAFPIMALALMGVFWLTITGANYPSRLIGDFLFWTEGRLLALLISLRVPQLVCEMLVSGIYRVLVWVISVMLPPMAIFFPLFTLLEDVGFLPRIAFNLDKCFKKCCACGKQALTMCMVYQNLQRIIILA